jgi:polar amino acid transport system substrate-binding protein
MLVKWQDGQPSGFEYELMQAIADDMSLELNYIEKSSDDVYSPLGTAWDSLISRADASANSIDEHNKLPGQYYRAPEGILRLPYFNDNLVCLVRVDSDVVDLGGLSGKTIGLCGDPDDDLVLSALPDFVQIRYIYSYEGDIAALQAGLVDAIVVSEDSTNDIFGFFDKHPNLRSIGVLCIENQYVLSFERDNSELMEAVNASLNRLIIDGTYSEIFARYFSYAPTLSNLHKQPTQSSTYLQCLSDIYT